MNAVGQQMALARGGTRRRPAPGAGAGLRDRGVRRGEPVERLGERARRAGLGAGRRQRLDAHLQFRRRRSRHRLPPRSALPGRPRRRLCRGQPVGRTASWAAAGPTRVSVAAYGSFTQGRLLCRRAGGLRLLQQPDAAADPDPRPAAAHRQRQHRRQPVPGPDRDRLQARRLRAGRRELTPFAPPAGLDRDAERLHGMGRQLAQPQRGAADDQLAAHGVRRRPRRRIALGNERKLDLALRLGWLHEYADTGRPITAAFAGAPSNAFTVLRRHAAARRRGDRLLASTTIAEATQLYLRYDGEISRAPTTTRSISACASPGRLPHCHFAKRSAAARRGGLEVERLGEGVGSIQRSQ